MQQKSADIVYHEQIKLALQYNQAYYDEDNPMVSDAAYDKLMLDIKTYEANHPNQIDPHSPTQHVGGTATSNKVTHKVPLLSLQDIFDTTVLTAIWNTRFQQPVTIETKVDGLSLALVYKDGHLTQGITRGDGHIGEDVTANAKAIINIPHHLSLQQGSTLIVRCEAYLSKADVERINADPTVKRTFQNPRNAAAGTLRTANPAVTASRGLKAVAFQILYSENLNVPDKQSDRLRWLTSMGFQTVSFFEADNPQDICAAIELIDKLRPKLPFDIDGAVVKLNQTSQYAAIGETEKYPRWAVAYKYPAEKKETRITQILTQTGRTGVITPVAVFDPVQLAGTTVQKATLHNMNFIENVLGDIAVGDTVLVHKSGEIIPEILAITKKSGNPKFQITECPVCHSKPVIGKDEHGNSTQTYCSNPDCPALLQGHLIHWCSKSVMNIPGLGPKGIEALLKADMCHSLSDLYNLTVENCISVFKEKRGRQIHQAIQNSKTQNIDRLIAGLGLPGVGRQLGELLAASYPDMDAVMYAARMDELQYLDGIGDITALTLQQYATNPDSQNRLAELKQKGLNWVSQSYQKHQPTVASALSGKTVVISGSLPGISRQDAASYLKQNGVLVRSAMSDKIDYLITEGDTTGSKYQFAVNHQIPMLEWAECLQMLQENQ